MRRLAALLLFVCSCSVLAQKSPVDWQFHAQELTNNEFLIYCKAKLVKDWYIYSQDIEGTPPIPTSIHLSPNSDFKLLGGIEEKGVLIDEYDEALDKNVKKYANQVSFIAKVKTNQPVVLIDGFVEYMTCDHEKCLPPAKRNFQFKLQATRSEQLAIRKSTNTTVASARKYTAETYTSPDRNINIPQPAAIELSSGGAQSDEAKPSTYSNTPDRIISNAERTTVLENSNNMVAANVMAYFAKGREMKQQQLLAEQRAQEKAEQLAAAQEAARIAAEEKAKRAIITEAPVDWTFYMNSLGEGVYEMVANVKIAENWYIYSKNNTGDAPFALQFEFAPNDKVEYTELGVQEIGQLRSEYDALFDKQVNRYANEITFKRQVKFLDNVPVHGSVRFMCADAEQYLMPTEVQFTFNDAQNVVLPTKKSMAGWWVAAVVAALAAIAVGQVRKIWTKKQA